MHYKILYIKILMSKLRNLWMSLLLSSQIASGNSNVNQVPKKFSEWDKSEIVFSDKSQLEQIWNTSDAIYEALETDNSIAYTLVPWSKVYKDSEGKEVLLSSPKWIVIRNNAINQEESTQDFLCVEYRGHKAWISTKSLTENQW